MSICKKMQLKFSSSNKSDRDIITSNKLRFELCKYNYFFNTDFAYFTVNLYLCIFRSI